VRLAWTGTSATKDMKPYTSSLQSFFHCKSWILAIVSHLRHPPMLPSVSGMCKPLCISGAGWGVPRYCRCGHVCTPVVVTMCWVQELSCSVWVGFRQAQSSELASVAGEFARCHHQYFLVGSARQFFMISSHKIQLRCICRLWVFSATRKYKQYRTYLEDASTAPYKTFNKPGNFWYGHLSIVSAEIQTADPWNCVQACYRLSNTASYFICWNATNFRNLIYMCCARGAQ
jgi:hypothetical protein